MLLVKRPLRGTVRHTGRMDITARSEYAVRTMLTLAAGSTVVEGRTGSYVDPRGEPVSVESLAQAQDLPRKFLEAIVADLRKAGLITSRRGARGGYLLARPEAEIRVGDIIRAVDGPLAEVRGLRPHDTTYTGEAQHLPTLWVATRAALRQVLDGTTLAQLRAGSWPAPVSELLRQPDAWESR